MLNHQDHKQSFEVNSGEDKTFDSLSHDLWPEKAHQAGFKGIFLEM